MAAQTTRPKSGLALNYNRPANITEGGKARAFFQKLRAPSPFLTQ